MTVLSPSLPPVSCSMTRTVSLAPGSPAAPAARAVRARNAGAAAPHAMSPVDLRKSRRLNMLGPLWGDCLAPLAPCGRGAGGEGFLPTCDPSPLTPLPQGARGTDLVQLKLRQR